MALYDNIADDNFVCSKCGNKSLYELETHAYTNRCNERGNCLMKEKTGTNLVCSSCWDVVATIQDHGSAENWWLKERNLVLK